MRVSVIIPTYLRLDRLQECLKGMDRQTRLPDEVIVVWRDSDEATGRWLQIWLQEPCRYIRRAVSVHSPGVTHAMESGLSITDGDVVTFIDDDAVPRPDWLGRMETHYNCSRVAGVGGRDVINGNTEPLVESQKVGRLSWYGRLSGNHHLGSGGSTYVDVLKGVNMSFRRELVQIPQFLKGQGAQVHFEVYVCLRIRSMGYDLIYDPAVEVDHFPAQRFDADQRNQIVPAAVRNAAYNLTVSMLMWLPWYRKILRILYGIFVGDRAGPGFIRFLVGVLQNDKRVTRSLLPSWKGQVGALLIMVRSNEAWRGRLR